MSTSVRIERLESDLRLKEADNRFLQEELEKKDRMLAMLTEGLREVIAFICVDSLGYLSSLFCNWQVETSQQEWLSTNQELSDDLEKALMNNAWLAQELLRLQQLLTKAGVDPALIQSSPPPQKSHRPGNGIGEEY